MLILIFMLILYIETWQNSLLLEFQSHIRRELLVNLEDQVGVKKINTLDYYLHHSLRIWWHEILVSPLLTFAISVARILILTSILSLLKFPQLFIFCSKVSLKILTDILLPQDVKGEYFLNELLADGMHLC